jgi:thioester reductase-like protein
MPSILFTGFPGFLGSALLPRVLRRSPDADAVCLVQAKFAGQAKEKVDALSEAEPSLAGRIRLVEGDITEAGLGLDGAGTTDTTEIFHLAAVYDLAVPRDLAMRVNVDGTRNVVRYAQECSSLTRLQYVSTCYVSGRYDGVFGETDLDVGQTFNNFYEETKHLAEVEVQEAMRDGLPASVYRPSVVVGDSKTGATQKYDGPYFVIQWLLRQPAALAFLPTVGDVKKVRFNVVPSDFVVDAIAYLCGQADTTGKVFALADPNPLTIDELITEIGRATRRRLIRIPLPLSVGKAAIERVPGVYRLLRIPSPALDYFTHPTTYDTSNASAALAAAGITVPPFGSYVGTLVDFMQAHPEVGAAAMV